MPGNSYRVGDSNSDTGLCGLPLLPHGLLCRAKLVLFCLFSFGLSIVAAGTAVAADRSQFGIWRSATADLRSVFYLLPDTDIGWAVGYEGTLLKTTDGGDTWKHQFPMEGSKVSTVMLYDVFFNDPLNGWVVGQQGRVFKTVNGGLHWELVKMPDTTDAHLRAVYFADEKHGWIVGEDGKILHTSDGGLEWKPQSVNGGLRLRDVHFVDSSHGIAVGNNFTLLRTSDGGSNWVPLPVSEIRDSKEADQTIELFGVAYDASDGAWLVAGKGIVIRVPERNSPASVQQRMPVLLRALSITPGQTSWAVGARGAIWQRRLEAGEWQPFVPQSNADMTLKRLSLYSVTPRPGGGVTVSGERGLLLHIAADGNVRYARSPNSKAKLNAIHFSDITQGWAVGTSAKVLHTSNAGAVWVEEKSLKEHLAESNPGAKIPSLRDVHAVDALNIWIVGDRETVARSTDGGKKWQIIALPGAAEQTRLFNAVFFFKDKGWIVGNGPRIFRSTDGGSNWSEAILKQKTKSSNITLRDVYFVDDLHGWAVGGGGTILESEDGGESWSEINKTSNISLNAIRVVGSGTDLRGVAAGYDDGAIFSRQRKGPGGWKRHAETATPGCSSRKSNLRGLELMADGSGWLVGDRGLRCYIQSSQTLVQMPAGSAEDIYAVDLVGDTGWYAGKNVLAQLVPVQQPTLSDFKVANTSGEHHLQGQVADQDSGMVSLDLSYSTDKAQTWTPLATNDAAPLRVNVSKGAAKFFYSWNPAHRVGIANNRDIYYRIEVTDGVSPVLLYSPDKGYAYRTWLYELVSNRYILSALVVLAVALGYIGLALFLTWKRPLLLIRLNGLNPFARFQGSSSTLVDTVLSLLAAITSKFCTKPRVIRAWADEYASGRAQLDDLGPGLRAIFIQSTVFLDAWVSRHRPVATAFHRQILERISEQGIYVPTPMHLDHPGSGRVITTPAPANLREFFSDHPARLLFIGNGGTGKSTLASNIGLWALSDQSAGRLAQHCMLPLFIRGDTLDLESAIEQALTSMLGANEVESDVQPSLLRKGRLMVIIDGLSERSEETRGHLQSEVNRLGVGVLLVTSRTSFDFDGGESRKFYLGDLNEAALMQFTDEYLNQRSVPSPIADSSGFRRILSHGLVDLMYPSSLESAEHGVSNLLARLFIDDAIERSRPSVGLEGIQLQVLASEIMLTYLLRTSPECVTSLGKTRFLSCCKELAYWSLEKTFQPGRGFDKEHAVAGVLSRQLDVAAAGDLIDQLSTSGSLEAREVTPGFITYTFRFDPLAEYLAAMERIEWARNIDAEQPEIWHQWVERFTQISGYPEVSNGFGDVLSNCIELYRESYGLYDFIKLADD